MLLEKHPECYGYHFRKKAKRVLKYWIDKMFFTMILNDT